MAAEERRAYKGRCYCGAVSFEARGLKNIWFCHCVQCRKLTGHYMAACRTDRSDIAIDGELKWTAVSENAAHGFCASCSSPMFWSNKTQDTISVAAGNIDDTSRLETMGHIFVGEKGDYYDVDDGLPQYDALPEGKL